jgi:hypothetical protein
VTSRTPAKCHTSPLNNSWWVADIGPSLRLQLTDYALRDGEDFLAEMVRCVQRHARLHPGGCRVLNVPLSQAPFPSVHRTSLVRGSLPPCTPPTWCAPPFSLGDVFSGPGRYWRLEGSQDGVTWTVLRECVLGHSAAVCPRGVW